MLHVAHGQVVGLQVAIARAPEYRPGMAEVHQGPELLRPVVVDELGLESCLVADLLHVAKLLDPLVVERHAQRAHLAPPRVALLVFLQPGEGLYRPHCQLDAFGCIAYLSDQARGLGTGCRGYCGLFLDE